MNELPVLEVDDFLVVSIQRELHDEDAESLQREIVQRLQNSGSKGVVIDVTALDVVDSFLGRLIGDTAKMAMMMGADTVLTGLQPQVAITLVDLGIEFENVQTALTMEEGLEYLREAD